MSEPLLHVEDLRLELDSGAAVVEDVSLSLDAGQILALVGESGSGKTTAALALLGHCRSGIRFGGGTVRLAGHELTGRPEAEIRALRGRLVSYVAQEPGTALNPAIRIGDQVAEMVQVHMPERDAAAETARALESVQLPSDEAFRRRFPHQLSGGQQHRVAMAIALVCQPALVVLDEPTTGLDVIVQHALLAEVRRLRDELGLTIVLVSHDLAAVSSVADRIAVMYAGRVVEQGSVANVLGAPRHPYTRGLVSAVPDLLEPRGLHGIPGSAPAVRERPGGCSFAPRCAHAVERCRGDVPALEVVAADHVVRCVEWHGLSAPPPAPPLALGADARGRDAAPVLEVVDLRATHEGKHDVVVAADRISFALGAGECVALVGESGSGKTTIARTIVGLHRPAAGRILLGGVPLAGTAAERTRDARRRIQIIFQNPYEALNPRHTVEDLVARPARLLRGLGRAEASREAAALLERVRLPARTGARYPAELSGGERQRVGIARALAAGPDVIVCDEITSALDVSVQAAVLELLGQLREELGLSLLYISHDLAVVATMCDRALVLNRGEICEEGRVGPLLRSPRSDYAQRLVASVPRLEAAAQ